MAKQSVVLGATAAVSVAVVVGLFFVSRRRAKVAAAAAAEAARLTVEAEKAANAAAESARAAADIEARNEAKELEKRKYDAEMASSKEQRVANAAAAVGVKAPASGAKTEVATAPTVPKAEADLAPHASVAVCYGSQTGNAKAIAQDMFEILSDAGVKCALSDLNSWKKWELPLEETSLMVAVVSTTGNGDPPDNMEKFHRFLKKRAHPSNLLNKLEFAVLALGDTNYDKFCEMGKWMNQRLKELGASPFLPLGCADEGTGLEDVVEPWCVDLKTVLLQKLAKGGKNTTAASNSNEESKDASTTTASPAAVVTEAPQPSSSSSVAFEKRPMPALLKARNLLPFHEAVGGAEVAAACVKAVSALAPNLMHKPAGIGLYTETFLPPSQAATYGEVEETKGATFDAQLPAPSPSSSLPTYEEGAPFLCEVAGARYLTVGGRSSERRVIHAELKPLDAKAPPVPFKVGDSVGLRCANQHGDVQEVLRAVGAAASSSSSSSSNFSPVARVQLTLTRSGLPAELPYVGLQGGNGSEGGDADSVTAVLRWGVDLSSALKPSFCAALATCCHDPLDRAALMALAAKNGSNGVDCFDLVVKQQSLRVAELLAMFPSCAPPLGLLVAALPPLAMRFYSIASSPLDKASTMAVAFSVVEWQTSSGQKALRRGLCTPWLEDALQTQVITATTGKDQEEEEKQQATNTCQQVVECTLKPSAEFTLPQDLAAPCILIGPGTGVAPFVGFLKHRSLQRQQLTTCVAHASSRLEAAKATLAEITTELGKAEASAKAAAAPAPAAAGGKRGNGKRRNKRDKAPSASSGGSGAAAAAVEANEHVTALRALQAEAAAEVAAQEKEALAASQAAESTKFGDMRLYFGCRHEEQDFLYKEELAALQAEGTLTTLRTAFSRDGPTKVYVQHKLMEDFALLKDLLLHQGAHLFVCGDGLNMARDVHLALVAVLASSHSSSNGDGASKEGVKEAPLTEVGAEAWLQAMKEQGKYVQDIWS